MKRGARIFNLMVDDESGSMEIDTWIHEEEGTVDHQEEFTAPTPFSWLRSSYCYGAENLSHGQWTDFLNNPISPF